MRPKQTHCKRGHEIAKVGRDGKGMCKRCKALSKRVGSDLPDRHASNTAPVKQGEVLWLDARPFSAWLRKRREVEGTRHLAIRLGLSEERVNAICRVQYKNVHIDVVDHALCRDGTVHLRNLYPHLYADHLGRTGWRLKRR